MRFAFLLLSALAACSSPEPSGTASPNGVEASSTVQATGFLTRNTQAPDGASDTKGDGVMRDSYGRPFEYALLGEPLAAFTAPMLGGGTFDSEALDRWTIIDIWGIWCGDCRADAPYVDALSRAIAQDPDLDFLSIHVPASAARASPEEMFGKFGSVEAYFQSVGHSYPVIVDTDASLRETLQVAWTPSYLLVSPDGIVRGFRTELAAAGGEPVKDFLRDVANVKRELRETARIGPDGAMGLTRETVFTLPAVSAAFPGHEVVSDVEGEGYDREPVFLVRSSDGDTRFRIAPDWTRGYVGLVSTRNPAVQGPGGALIGATRLASLSPADAATCAPPPGRTDLVACPLPGGFVWVFAADGESVLVEMQYRPPVPEGKPR